MPAYDPNLFDPPAPLARVTLRAIQNGHTVTDVPMLIDSGSDLTLVPEPSVTELGVELVSSQQVELKGFDEEVSIANSVEIDLAFLGLVFRGRLPVINSPIGILGRNVLNRFKILLDGPRLNWDELSDSAK